MTKKTIPIAITISFLLAFITITVITGANIRLSPQAGIIKTSSMLPQLYTSVTFTDPALSSVDPAISRAFVYDLLHDTIQGTGTAADGTVALPYVEPPSLMVTRDVVEALLALDGVVPSAAAIAAWTWSCWRQTTGYFDDEYSVNWSTLLDGSGWIATNRYSPVVATACALDILGMLKQPVPSAVNDSIRMFLMACHDPLTGSFKGKVTPSVEPTLQDAVWAIHALGRMGRQNYVDASTCAAYIVSLRGTDGLYKLHDPAIIVPASEYLGGTIPVTRLAIEALLQLGQLGAIDLNTTRSDVMNLYNATDKHFAQDPYSPSRTSLATVDALHILATVGFPTGFVAEQIPAIVEEYSRKQLPGGGWAAEDGSPLAVTSLVSRVVTELLKVTGTTGAIDLAKIRSILASSLTSNPGSGMAAYCPYPANRPVLPATVALSLLAASGGMVDAAAEAAARQLVSASSADGSGTYPRKYPGAGSLAYIPGDEFRTFGTGGIVTLAGRVALKDAMSVPFMLADLNEIALLLSQIQYKSSIPGIQGLCLARHDVSATIGLPGVNPRVASLENTLAAVRIIDTLRDYGNGTWFVPARFLDLGLLYGRLASAYRESGTVAWFEREYPASFQQPSGLDNARLRDTRLAIEIINATRGFGDSTVRSAINIAKIASLALTEPRRTVTDIDNAVAILAMVNATTTLTQRMAVIGQIQSFKVAGSVWYTRVGLPSTSETIRALEVLSRFSGIASSVDHVVANGSTALAIAGTTISVSVCLSNCFSGPGSPRAFNYTLLPLDPSGNAVLSPATIQIPLQEAALGPALLEISTSGASLSPSIQIPMGVTGVLYLPHTGSRVELSATTREPFTAVLDLRLVDPDDTSRQVPIHNAQLSATGLSIDNDICFAFDNASKRYQAVLRLNPLDGETQYRLIATLEHCIPFDAVLAVRCTDSLSYAPFVVLPSCLVGGLICVTFIARRTITRKECGTVARSRHA